MKLPLTGLAERLESVYTGIRSPLVKLRMLAYFMKAYSTSFELYLKQN